MKRWKNTKWNPISDEKLRSFVDFMNGGSEEAEQLREAMPRIVNEVKRKWIKQYKFDKQWYEDIFGCDIEDDEDFDDIQF